MAAITYVGASATVTANSTDQSGPYIRLYPHASSLEGDIGVLTVIVKMPPGTQLSANPYNEPYFGATKASNTYDRWLIQNQTMLGTIGGYDCYAFVYAKVLTRTEIYGNGTGVGQYDYSVVSAKMFSFRPDTSRHLKFGMTYEASFSGTAFPAIPANSEFRAALRLSMGFSGRNLNPASGWQEVFDADGAGDYPFNTFIETKVLTGGESVARDERLTYGGASLSICLTYQAVEGFGIFSEVYGALNGASTINRPPFASTGDLLVAVIPAVNIPQVPSGWQQQKLHGTSQELAVYTKTVEAGEPLSYTWNVYGGTESIPLTIFAVGMTYSNALYPVTVCDVGAIVAGTFSNSSINAPAITPTYDGTTLVIGAASSTIGSGLGNSIAFNGGDYASSLQINTLYSGGGRTTVLYAKEDRLTLKGVSSGTVTGQVQGNVAAFLMQVTYFAPLSKPASLFGANNF